MQYAHWLFKSANNQILYLDFDRVVDFLHEITTRLIKHECTPFKK